MTIFCHASEVYPSFCHVERPEGVETSVYGLFQRFFTAILPGGRIWFMAGLARERSVLVPSERVPTPSLPLTVPRVARRPLRPLAKPSPCSSRPFCRRFRKYADGEMERRARKCRETVADPHSHDGGLPHFHRKSALVEIITSFPAVPPPKCFPSA